MSYLRQLYGSSLGLLTDFYELTMAYGYWKSGMQDREAAFHLVFRENPFDGGFTIACGLALAAEYLEHFRFDETDVAYLAGLRGSDGKGLFSRDFLAFLGQMRLDCDIDAMPEGTVVFPQEPLVRVVGPLIQAQIIETALLNILNFQTLVATKAARVAMAARGEPVLEFGLRRAQGIDGGLAASRAAYIGGCAGTSNVLAGKLLGIPVKGTMAHSWVMCFDDELESFAAYARAMPNNTIFLVDTYNTLEGVRRAIEAAHWLRSEGHAFLGIRLDSGDLAYLSTQARRMLDEAGFHDAAIVASGDLDEHIITSLKQQNAAIGVWGVGTKLATAYDQPALGGVYKLTAIRQPPGEWQDRIKLSEQKVKISTPGMLQVRRFVRSGEAVADMIYDERTPPGDEPIIVDPVDSTRRKTIGADASHSDLLVPIFRAGKRVYPEPGLDEARRRTAEQLALFHPGVKRFVYPHQYPAGLDVGLHDRKQEMILRERGFAP